MVFSDETLMAVINALEWARVNSRIIGDVENLDLVHKMARNIQAKAGDALARIENEIPKTDKGGA